MKRLISKGLMFGNLVRVESPALVERYNRALSVLNGKRTALSEFHVDISGFSPEVAVELGEPLYLNPNGVNRQFILLTTEQKTAPLLDATFSNERAILKRFITENEAQLFALTARDAVAGEIVDTVFSVETPARLFDLRKFRIEADTTGGTVKDAEALGRKLDRFLSEEDAWFDDVLIAEMIGLSKKTGDVTRNPVRLKQMEFIKEDFWTSHFGGGVSLPLGGPACGGIRGAEGGAGGFANRVGARFAGPKRDCAVLRGEWLGGAYREGAGD